MTQLLLVKFKISGVKKAYTLEAFDEAIVDPFFFEGGIEVSPMRFGNEAAAIRWLEVNKIQFVSE